MPTIDISSEDESAFFDLALNGLANLNWENRRAIITLTPRGEQIIMAAVREATSVPDDPIALQAQVEMWRERALKAEALLKEHVESHPAVHNHGPEDGPRLLCREYYTSKGHLRGECLDKETNK